MDNHPELNQSCRQTEAEIDALELLWRGTMNEFMPERQRFSHWLQLAGYVETVRCINKTGNQFIRNRGLMLPRQILTFMDRAVIRIVIRTRKHGELQKEID